jgi:hypothetical protein
VTTQRFLAKASTADGVVVRVDKVVERSREGDRYTLYYPVVRFVTTSGQVVEYCSLAGPVVSDEAGEARHRSANGAAAPARRHHDPAQSRSGLRTQNQPMTGPRTRGFRTSSPTRAARSSSPWPAERQNSFGSQIGYLPCALFERPHATGGPVQG